MKTAFNHLDLFAGIGGFALAFNESRLQLKKRYYSEIYDHASGIYQRHFPDAVPIGDITNYDFNQLKKISGPWIITGGFPCQDISSAGLRRGITGQRSGLWHYMFQAISTLRPAYAVIENVRPLVSSGFEQILLPLADIGYDAEWQCIPVSAVGGMHVRKRIWIVAYPKSHGLTTLTNEMLKEKRDLGNKHESNKPYNFLLSQKAWETAEAKKQLHGEPLLYRMHDGLSSELDRIRGLGNAICPQIAESIFNRIHGTLKGGGRI